MHLSPLFTGGRIPTFHQGATEAAEHLIRALINAEKKKGLNVPQRLSHTRNSCRSGSVFTQLTARMSSSPLSLINSPG